MPTILAYLYAAFAGALTNVQDGAELKLFRGLHNPALTAFVILGTGPAVVGVALVLSSAISGAGLPGRAELAGIPWWGWAGGALQGLTVLAVFLTSGRAGAAVVSALTVTGGAICSILLDHFGLSRVAAAALLIGGSLLMMR